MDRLAQEIQEALNNGRITSAVVLDGNVMVPAHGTLGIVQPPLGPLVKPAIIDTKGAFHLYADGSVGSDAMDEYNKGYHDPGYPYYGFMFADNTDVFPQIKNDPTMYGSNYLSQAGLTGPFGNISETQQGQVATLAADGHGYVHGSVHGLRGVLATKYKTTDVPTWIESLKQRGEFLIQVEQGASGKAFP